MYISWNHKILSSIFVSKYEELMNRNLSILPALLILSLLLASCSVQRFLSVDEAGYMTPDSITEQYHPAGIVEERIYDSSVFPGPTARRMLVYLPAGYYENDTRYPVMYLFHGARGNETSWIKDGGMFAILDSLQSCGVAGKMITVLPNMNQYDDDADFNHSRFKHPVESLFEVDGTVESGFVDDVVAIVDSLYRTKAEKSGRAIAGLSIGAMQSIFISAAYPDMFDYVGLFSPMCKSVIKHSGYSSFYKDLYGKMERQFETPPELYFIAIGRKDIFHSQMEDFRHDLDKRGYGYEYFESDGGHGWESWRLFYSELLPKLFQE